jgi:hypothetical protein
MVILPLWETTEKGPPDLSVLFCATACDYLKIKSSMKRKVYHYQEHYWDKLANERIWAINLIIVPMLNVLILIVLWLCKRMLFRKKNVLFGIKMRLYIHTHNLKFTFRWFRIKKE